MFESIYIGMSGLQGYSQGLRVIANNTANINTPGYKGATLQFADMFYSNSNPGTGSGTMQVGYGLNTAGTVLNFEQGELRQTGNSMDLAVDGQGLFTLQDESGNLHYTRAGQFTFNADGVLVSRVDGSKVMGMGADGSLSPITIDGKSTAMGKATTTVKFAQNLSSTAPDFTIDNVKVIDSLGGTHDLTVKLTNKTGGDWLVELFDGATQVDTAADKHLIFSAGTPTAASSKPVFNYTPPGFSSSMAVTLDFSTNVTSLDQGATSSLAFTSQDGYAPGSLTGVSFDGTGTMVLAYSNGQTVKDVKLALGRFDSLDAVKSVGNNQFDATNALAWHTGTAGDNGFGSVRAGMVELSNVDLSQEFSDLVIMQRGYQSSSQVISTANDMLQELFQMKSK